LRETLITKETTVECNGGCHRKRYFTNKTKREIDKILRNDEGWVVSKFGDYCHECRKVMPMFKRSEGVGS